MRVAEVKRMLSSIGIHPRQAMGQNFLLDERVVSKIVKIARLDKSKEVLEVGPGLGILTYALVAQSKKVAAVELDKALVRFLRQEFLNRAKIIHGDIIKILKKGELSQIMPKYYTLVANLPYQITSHFFRLIFLQKSAPTKMVVMVQKEVAKRIVAKPGSMSRLSFFVGWFGKARVAMQVSRKSFWPMPKVDSAVLEIEVYRDPRKHWGVTKKQESVIFSMVSRGFVHKRKLLVSNVANTKIHKQAIQDALIAIGKDPQARAQELSCHDWVLLGKNLSQIS